MEYRQSEDTLPFKWAMPPQQQQSDTLQFPHDAQLQETSTDASADGVVSTIKQIVNTFINTQTESTLFTSSASTEANLEETFNSNNTMMAMNETSLDETFGSNNTVMEMTEASITEMFGSNATVMELNATTITEMVDSNAGVTIAATNETSFVSDTLSTVVDTVATSTETVFNTVSEAVTQITKSDTDGMMNSETHTEYVEEKTLYIVLGVILGALILLIIVLLIIYRRYKNQRRGSSGVYCVSDLHEVRTSSDCRNYDQRMVDE